MTGIAERVASLEARVAALEAQLAENTARITDLTISDEASGWRRWREQREGAR